MKYLSLLMIFAIFGFAVNLNAQDAVSPAPDENGSQEAVVDTQDSASDAAAPTPAENAAPMSGVVMDGCGCDSMITYSDPCGCNSMGMNMGMIQGSYPMAMPIQGVMAPMNSFVDAQPQMVAPSMSFVDAQPAMAAPAMSFVDAQPSYGAGCGSSCGYSCPPRCCQPRRGCFFNRCRPRCRIFRRGCCR